MVASKERDLDADARFKLGASATKPAAEAFDACPRIRADDQAVIEGTLDELLPRLHFRACSSGAAE